MSIYRDESKYRLCRIIKEEWEEKWVAEHFWKVDIGWIYMNIKEEGGTGKRSCETMEEERELWLWGFYPNR